MNHYTPDERQAYAEAFAAGRKHRENCKKAKAARARKDKRAMGKYRSRCANSLLDELAATNAVGYVGKADTDYVNAGRGQ